MSSSQQLSIQLNDADGQPLPPDVRPLFVPFQRVSGTVNLVLAKATTISRVVLRFRGTISTTTLAARRNVSPNVHTFDFFSFETVVFVGEQHKLRAATHSWPFSFVFPETFDFQEEVFEENERSERFWVGRGVHPLPPSMEVGIDAKLGEQTQLSKTRGEISYKLQVTVPRKLAPDWVLKVPLDFTPIRSELNPAPRVQRIIQKREQKFRYDVHGQPRALTTSETLKDKFKSSPETRSFPFQLACRAPTVAVLGKPHPVFVKLDYMPLPGVNVVTPLFTLERIKAHLVAFNNLRALGTFGDISLGDRVEGFAKDIPLLDNQELLSCALRPGEVKRIDGIFTTNIVAPPSFSSISVNRKYALVITLTIKWLDENTEISFRWDKLMLLSARMAEGVEEAATLVRSENSQTARANDGLPNFREAIAGIYDAPPPDVHSDVSPPPYQETQGARLFGGG